MSSNNFNNITFFGGIHGVGKSTICKKICNQLNINYLSASEVLNWNKLNSDLQNKKVDDIFHTQELLINGLDKYIENDKKYLLDGHYCLLNKHDQITKLPVETFKRINPISLYIIINDVAIIKSRLEARDNKAYNYDILSRMQDLEIEYATELSKELNRNLIIGKESDYNLLLNSLQSDFN